MIEVGQKVRFDPFYYVGGYCAEVIRGHLVTGTVVMVNEPHKWFSVEYGNPKARASFKFSDIGQVVSIVGRNR